MGASTLPFDHLLPVPYVLKFHLCSESKNDSMPRSCAHIRVILNHRLQKKHWQRVKDRVEFKAMLRLELWRAFRHGLLTQAGLFGTQGNGVVETQWEVLRDTHLP